MTPMMRQYWSIKSQYDGCLLFYRMGDFYELFFEDAIIASQILGIALTKRGQHLSEDIPMCGVPFHAAQNYLHKLLRSNHKVAICEQMENPKEAKKRGAKSVVKREVVRIITPGTLLEETILDSSSYNYLCAIFKKKNMVSVAYADISTGDIFFTTIHPKQLQSLITRIDPKEILIPRILSQDEHISLALKDHQFSMEELPMAQFHHQNCLEALLKLYHTQTLEGFGSFLESEIIALGRLVDYIYLTQKDHIPRMRFPKKEEISTNMEIDSASRKSLEIDKALHENAKHHLLKVMDKCLTSMGKRLLHQRLSSPLIDIILLEKRYNEIEFFLQEEEFSESLKNILKNVPDLARAIGRLSCGHGGPRDIKLVSSHCMVAHTIKTLWSKKVRSMHESSYDLVFYIDIFENFISMLPDFSELIHTLDQALHDELPLLARDGGFVKKGFDAQLDTINYEKNESTRIISGLELTYKKETGIESLKVKYNNIAGYHIDIPTQKVDKVTDIFIHRQTMKNSVRYTTLDLQDWSQKMMEVDQRKLACEMRVFEELLEKILSHSDDLNRQADMMAEIDVALGLAVLAKQKNYCRPVLTKDPLWDVVKGYHPTVEDALHEDGKNFVTNDCHMSENERILLLTGPNMAGKSTFLRQNALIAIMAQAGSFVPAQKCHIGIVDKIFSRVGAADNLARGQSTFMVEMVETASIIHHATKNSFVIMDEVGRGTSTQDGLSLAWAIVEYIFEKIGCRTLFATHYHELTQLTQKYHAIKNISMKVSEWEDKIIFHHQVIEQAAEASYGIYVAQLAGMPYSITKHAKKLMLELNDKSGLTPQMSLFSREQKEHQASKEDEYKKIEQEILQELSEIDIDDLSPRDAFITLTSLVEKIKTSEKKIEKA